MQRGVRPAGGRRGTLLWGVARGHTSSLGCLESITEISCRSQIND